MGEKYELSFLSSSNNMLLLKSSSEILFENGWTYNHCDLGNYSYWLDGPIWEFGESIDIKESKRNFNSGYKDLNKVINKISCYYSPSIKLNKLINGKLSCAIISVVEMSAINEWKELSVSFEFNDVYDQKDFLKKIFIYIVNLIKPVYAISGLEIEGVPNNPELVQVDESKLGDYNFFSHELKNYCMINDLHFCNIEKVNNIGSFVFAKSAVK